MSLPEGLEFSGDVLGFVWLMLTTFWPIWLLLLTPNLLGLAFNIYRKRRLARAGMSDIDQMDGKSFELYLESLFKRQGYSVQLTPYRGDYGADLIISKEGRRTAVQAKRYKGKVGVKAVQEIAAARSHYECDDALVVTNNGFTAQAVKLAKSNNVRLWNRDDLAGAILGLSKEKAA